MKRILFGLGHPAHFHLYKNVFFFLKENDIEYKVVISDKDLLKKLLAESKINFTVIAKTFPSESLFRKIFKIISSSFTLWKIVKEFNPDILVGCLNQLAYVSLFSGKKFIFNAEDDFSYTYLQMLSVFPFVDTVLSPNPTNLAVFNHKKIGYPGYHKLAYLHPNYFKPDKKVLRKYSLESEKYFLIRLVNLNAHHDGGIKGLSGPVLTKVIDILKERGKILISSELPLSSELLRYEMKIDPLDVHHVMFFSELLVADSQSMTVEAAMLGTPSIKFNDFAGKISVLEELENKYQLTIGIPTSDEEKLLDLLNLYLSDKNLRHIYQERREVMLLDKIDVSKFFIWFYLNFPESKEKIRSDDFQFNNYSSDLGVN